MIAIKQWYSVVMLLSSARQTWRSGRLYHCPGEHSGADSAGFLVTLLLLSKMPAIGGFIISAVESSPLLLILIAVLCIVVMYAISIFLSIRIMEKKEMWGDYMDFTILVVVLLIGVGVPIRNKLIRKYRNKKKNDRNSEWTIWRKQSSSAAQSAEIKHATKFGKIPF